MGYKAMKYFSIWTLFFLLAFAACDSTVEDFDPSKFGFDYYPLEVGRTWTYQVDSIIYDDDGATVIETSSQIKEEIVDNFIDEAGETIYRIERFWRSDDQSSWQITDVWVSYTNDSQAFKTEENLKFIKFVFPAAAGTRWNGNIFFDQTSTIITVSGESLAMFRGWDEYRITDLDQTEEVGGISYDKVATVLQTDDREENTVERRYAMEKYAKGVGLIYKENIILDSQQSQSAAPWTEKAEKGFILKQTLIEYN
jgi:hypothetical protein